ncbi:MAG TPA: hypothetical protein VM261_03090 [Kofleriaceae bacterium]|nr:hypothetical protein [Kofleriaceae bacterium]
MKRWSGETWLFVACATAILWCAGGLYMKQRGPQLDERTEVASRR